MKIKDLLKKQRAENTFLWKLICRVIRFSSFVRGCINEGGAMILKSKIYAGDGLVSVGEGSSLIRCKFVINGKDSSIKIGKGCTLRNTEIILFGNGCNCVIRNNVMINATRLEPTQINIGSNSSVYIGKDALLSKGIGIYTTDFHQIYNLSNNSLQLNQNDDIRIGDRVWIGLGTTILKGAEIGDGCVVGATSLVLGKYTEENQVIAGHPAVVHRNNIKWEK